MSALDIQIDGNHYKTLTIQPVELAMKLNATPLFCKVDKYLTRVKDDPVQQYKKAIHCVQLEIEMPELADQYYNPKVLTRMQGEDLILAAGRSDLVTEVLLSMYWGNPERALQLLLDNQ